MREAPGRWFPAQDVSLCPVPAGLRVAVRRAALGSLCQENPSLGTSCAAPKGGDLLSTGSVHGFPICWAPLWLLSILGILRWSWCPEERCLLPASVPAARQYPALPGSARQALGTRILHIHLQLSGKNTLHPRLPAQVSQLRALQQPWPPPAAGRCPWLRAKEGQVCDGGQRLSPAGSPSWGPGPAARRAPGTPVPALRLAQGLAPAVPMPQATWQVQLYFSTNLKFMISGISLI